MSPLFTQAAEQALDLIDKNGVLLPFCRLTDEDDQLVVITPNGGGDLAGESVRVELEQRLEMKKVKQFAFCADVETKFAHLDAPQRCLRVEFQDGSSATGIYYFPLSIQDGRALLGKYLVADVAERKL